ncbi:MAG TPA: NADP-dependent isocitrate dehydrogenase [Verrucomicrobiales bacterium]|nr:NADP-dependent isocitrate dehydrogenase [Verrucomicrobiales bacterium]
MCLCVGIPFHAQRLIAVQGTPVEIGGYYHPEEKLVEAAMRPSGVLNGIIG